MSLRHEAARTERSSSADVIGPLSIGGRHVLVVTDDGEFAAVARTSFRDLAVEEAITRPITFRVDRPNETNDRWAIWRDDEACELTLEEDYVLFHLQWELNRVALESGDVTLHAAAAARHGRAVVLVGSSMSGKTTLAGWLAARGWTYVADEVVALTSDDRAIPFLRPLGVRHGAPLDLLTRGSDEPRTRFDEYEMLIAISQTGATSLARDPLPIAAVLFPSYDPGVAIPALVPIPKSEAFERLSDSAPGLSDRGAPVFRRLANLIRRLPTATLATNDLDLTVALVEQFFDDLPTAPAP